MSAALTAQPGVHRTAMAVSMKAKVKGKNRKRKKSTMAGGACATMMKERVALVQRVYQRMYPRNARKAVKT